MKDGCLFVDTGADKKIVFRKGALEGVGQFLASESPLKKMKNHFHFTLKALFVLKIFKFFVLTFCSYRKTI